MPFALRIAVFLTLVSTLNGGTFATCIGIESPELNVAQPVAADYPTYIDFDKYIQTLQPSEEQLRLEQVLVFFEQDRPAEARALYGKVQDLAPVTPEIYVNDAIRYKATKDLFIIYNQQQEQANIGALIDRARIENLAVKMKNLCTRYLAANAFFCSLQNPKSEEEFPRLTHNLSIIRSFSGCLDWLKIYAPTEDNLADTLGLIEFTERSANCLGRLPKADDLNSLDFQFAYATFFLHTQAAELYALRGEMVDREGHMATAKAIAEVQKNPHINLLFEAAHLKLAAIALLNNVKDPTSVAENIIAAGILDEKRKILLARFDQSASSVK